MQSSFPGFGSVGQRGSQQPERWYLAAVIGPGRGRGRGHGAGQKLTWALVSCCVLLAALSLLAGCSTIQQMMPAHREAERRAEKLQDLQLRVMRFADEYAGRTREVWTQFQTGATLPEDRLNAQSWKLQQAESVYTIASGSNPISNALDMIVLASLSRMVVEDVWVERSEDARVRPLLETHEALERGAWQLLEGQLTDDQAAELRDAITRWRVEHPEVYSVAYIHFRDFAKAISPRSGGQYASGSLFAMLGLDPLSGLDPAVRELAQTRELAERAIFYLQRMPSLLNMQVERLTYQLAVMPEMQSLLTDLERASLIGSAADHLATSLPDLLATEREALISQLMQGLNEQSASLGTLSGEVRSTLQAGTQTANALNSTLETLDRITARYPRPNPSAAAKNAPPFDIRQYTEMMRELTVATRELNALTQQVDTALPEVRLVTQDAAGHLEALLDRLFLQLLVLVAVAIVLTLLAALGYRAAITRMQRRNADRPGANS